VPNGQNNFLGFSQGQGNLAIPQFQSPNFVPGVSGWRIDRQGNAQFNSITVPAGTGGGATVFVQSATPTANHVNDIWVDTGHDNRILTWNGTAWALAQFGTGAIGNGAITTALLQAGIVVAGIVDATTINAATFIGSTFKGTNFNLNPLGEFYYAGTTPANAFAVTGVPIQPAPASPFAFTTVGTQDAILLEIVCSGSVGATAIASSNVTWSVLVGPTTLGTQTATVFIGKVNVIGNDSATITFNGATPAFNLGGIEIKAAGGFNSISLDTSGTVNAVTNNFPTLFPAAGGEFYFGVAFNANVATNGTTAGYFYTTDANGNGMCYNNNCGIGPQTPVWGDNPADQINGIAVLMKSAAGSGSGTSLTGSNVSAPGTDPNGNNYLEGACAYNDLTRTCVQQIGGTTNFYTMTPNPGAVFTKVGTVQGVITSAGSVMQIIGLLAGISIQGGNGNPGLITTDNNGIPIFTSATGKAYKAGMQHNHTGNNTLINSTGFIAITSITVDPGNYRLRARAVYNSGSTAAGVPAFGFAHGSNAHINLWTGKSQFWNAAGTGFTSTYPHVAGFPADTTGPTLAASSNYIYETDVVISVGVGGVITFSANTNIATDTYTVLSGSFIEVQPI
jgi:hypothetical protein